MKKRKLAVVGDDKDVQAAVLATFKELRGTKLSIDTTSSVWWTITVQAPGTFNIDKVNQLVTDTFGDAQFTWAVDMVQKRLEIRVAALAESSSNESKTSYEVVKMPFLPTPENENQTRIDSIRYYAQNYLGAETPAGVTLDVLDDKDGKLTDVKDYKGTELKLVIKGWKEANFEQLDTFRQMFPCHVQTVQVSDCTTITVHLQLRLAPLTRVFRRIKGVFSA